jgi:hypothetical protein
MHALIIEAARTERWYWKDLRRYRELFYFPAWRGIFVRYQQTVVGVAEVGLPRAMLIHITLVAFKLT